jgi:Tol biopolymer transport system component
MRLYWILALLLLAAVAAPAWSQPLPPPSTVRASVSGSGQQGNANSGLADLSDDGVWLTFASTASTLIPGVGGTQLYLRNLETDALHVVSVSTAGEVGLAGSTAPAISGNGRVVCFHSSASNLVEGDGNFQTDVFAHDRVTGSTVRVSVASDGTEGDGRSDMCGVSGDGRFVGFRSASINLVDGDTNGRTDIFVHDRMTGVTERITPNGGGRGLGSVALSGNGRFVAFDSIDPILVGDTNGRWDVYVRDRLEGDWRRASVASSGGETGNSDGPLDISADGDTVVFESVARLVIGDTNNIADVYIRGSGGLQRVSDALVSTFLSGGGAAPSVSADGRWVAFVSASADLVPGDTNFDCGLFGDNCADVFTWDSENGITRRVSVATDGTQANGDTATISSPSLSADGRLVVFRSNATNLVPGDTNGSEDVFLRDQGDVFPPELLNLAASPNPAGFGDDVDLVVTVLEINTGENVVAGAEYRVDGGVWVAMDANDGDFDETAEDAVATIPSAELQSPVSQVCVRGSDGLGNTSLAQCVAVTVEIDELPLAVTVTQIGNFSVGLDQLSEPDFYVRMFINPILIGENPDFENSDDPTSNTAVAEPFWTAGKLVGEDRPTSSIHIEVWDDDPGEADDQADASPDPGRDVLVVVVDPVTMTWTGDIEWPEHCARGDGVLSVQVCISISFWSTTGDQDGDGLLDEWERLGVDVSGDGNVDLDLPAMGADPLHKDLFLELDWLVGEEPVLYEERLFFCSSDSPLRGTPCTNSAACLAGRCLGGRDLGIEEMRRAFAAAPIDAGEAGISNPDGLPGINLWVDTLQRYEPRAYENRSADDECSNGKDDDGDGDIDGADSQCASRVLRTPSGQRPESIPILWECEDGIDNDGDGLVDEDDPSCTYGGDALGGGTAITADPDCLRRGFYNAKAANFDPLRRWVFRYAIGGRDGGCRGGRGEIGGNDFYDLNHDGGTIMHELGHTLNLRHGGFENKNCKPNYVSVMNYDNQFGISQNVGGQILDFSPPRFPGGRGAAILPTLVENDLDDPITLDPTDPMNQMLHVHLFGAKVRRPLNLAYNFNLGNPGQNVNLDTAGLNGQPRGCKNGSANSTLVGSDDWSQVQLNFRTFGDAADGALNPEQDTPPDREERLLMLEEVNRVDLGLSVSHAPMPAVSGAALTFSLLVRNDGLNPADQTIVRAELPAGVTLDDTTAACEMVDPEVLECVLGTVLAGEDRAFDIDVTVNEGVSGVISLLAAVDSEVALDTDEGNDSATEDVEVVAPDDGDGVPAGTDNCTEVANPLQGDADDDGFGDACDCDFDQNGFCNISDYDLFVRDLAEGVDNGAGTDMNEDGVVDAADQALFFAGFARGEPGPSAPVEAEPEAEDMGELRCGLGFELIGAVLALMIVARRVRHRPRAS